MAAMRIRARVRAGKLEPVEKLDLPEGEEVTLTVDRPETSGRQPATVRVLEGAVLDAPYPLRRSDIYGRF